MQNCLVPREPMLERPVACPRSIFVYSSSSRYYGECHIMLGWTWLHVDCIWNLQFMSGKSSHGQISSALVTPHSLAY